jgi:acetyltransferase-like isoleucine patch superfamily enzyme
MGAVVIDDVPDDAVVVGNPAQPILVRADARHLKPLSAG